MPEGFGQVKSVIVSRVVGTHTGARMKFAGSLESKFHCSICTGCVVLGLLRSILFEEYLLTDRERMFSHFRAF